MGTLDDQPLRDDSAGGPVFAGEIRPQGPSPAAIAIPDKGLEAALRAVLQEPKGDLTEQKLMNVYVLEADGKEVKDLAGLDKCKNLALLKQLLEHGHARLQDGRVVALDADDLPD